MGSEKDRILRRHELIKVRIRLDEQELTKRVSEGIEHTLEVVAKDWDGKIRSVTSIYLKD